MALERVEAAGPEAPVGGEPRVDLRERLYDDSDEAQARRAFDRLRPQATAPYRVPCPLDAQPALPTLAIVCAGDRMVAPDWAAQVARVRLGVEAAELAGDHSPQLSRPAELAGLLDARV